MQVPQRKRERHIYARLPVGMAEQLVLVAERNHLHPSDQAGIYVERALRRLKVFREGYDNEEKIG